MDDRWFSVDEIAELSNLRPGEAFIWSSKAIDEAFTKSAVKIRCRPRVTHHGGDTKTAVGCETGLAMPCSNHRGRHRD